MTINSQGVPIMDRHKRRWISNVLSGVAILVMIFSFVANADAGRRDRIVRGFFNSSNQAIVVVDENHEVVLFSQGAEELLGWKAKDVEGTNMDFLVPQELCPAHNAAFEHRFASEDDFIHHDNASALIVRCEANTAILDPKTGKHLRKAVRMTLRPFEVEGFLGYGKSRYVSAILDAKDDVQFLNTFNGRRYGKGTTPGERLSYMPLGIMGAVGATAEAVVVPIEKTVTQQ